LSKPKILVFGEYESWDQEPMESEFQVHYAAKDGSVAHLTQEIRDSIQAFAFRGHDFLGEQTMDVFPNLALISNLGVGYDTIDVKHASTRGIKVTNTPDVLTSDVADLGVGMMIVQCRSMLQASDWIRSGNWQSKGEFALQTKISGKAVGIVGLGRIGRAVAERLQPFAMDIHYYSRTEQETPGWTYHNDIRDLAETVDILFVTLSGGPATQGLIDKSVIKALGRSGLLINVSRGSTVDESALLDALENGELGSAGLDVFQSEPNLDPRFLKLDNVLLQPHQSSGTHETRQEMGKLQRANLTAHFAGQPLLTPVN